eukprot:Nitzschia sp. Nitz4//scaffold22_size323478//177028//177804//NITZ4_000545-RA/size323478-processed-gene-0.469-mRNA-1//-1//CDS//3329543049//7260//frame0
MTTQQLQLVDNTMSSMQAKDKKKIQSRGSASVQFPGKLHDLMTYTDRQGLDHIISWVQNGTALMVHNPEKLLEILPMFGFGQTKYRSFQRQLNMWHWERIVDGPYKGAWRHPYFVRGNKTLCRFMSRHLFSNNSSVSPSDSPIHINKGDFPSSINLASSLSMSFPSLAADSFAKDMMNIPANMKKQDVLPSVPQLSRQQGGQTLRFEHRNLDFLDEIVPTDVFDASSILEPTPIFAPTSSTANHLLEPLSADIIDTLF